MIVEFSVYDTNSYAVEHLLESKENAEQFVQFHVKPKYDDGCIFMYQIL